MKFSINDIVTAFLSEKSRKAVWGNYRIEGQSLVYRATVSDEVKFDGKESQKEIEKKINGRVVSRRGETLTIEQVMAELKDYARNFLVTGTEENEVARKIKLADGSTVVVGNSSVLPLIGRTVAYGHERRNSRETEVQRELSRRGCIMVPFTVFEQAGLDLNKFEVIERGPEETLKIKVEVSNAWSFKENDPRRFRDTTRHFTGACLFKVDGKTYLFDVDRREVAHKIFNPFLATLKGSPKTIKAAYQSLKPKEVIQAESKGLKVLRQGEWFFVPCRAPKIPKLTKEQKLTALLRNWTSKQDLKLVGLPNTVLKDIEKFQAMIPKRGQIRAGNSRPNDVQTLFKVGDTTYCTGLVTHSGREHAPLKLKQWYRVYGNTSVLNLTITGDID